MAELLVSLFLSSYQKKKKKKERRERERERERESSFPIHNKLFFVPPLLLSLSKSTQQKKGEFFLASLILWIFATITIFILFFLNKHYQKTHEH